MKKLIVVFVLASLLLVGCSAPSNTWGWYVVDPSNPNGLVNISEYGVILYYGISSNLLCRPFKKEFYGN